MKLKLAGLPILLLLVVSTTGCGGFGANPSVSPASFFLPGLLKAEPRPQTPGAAEPGPQQVRQVVLNQ